MTAGLKKFFPKDLLICLAIALATLGTYSEVRHFDYVGYDDPSYPLNPHVAQGLSLDSIRWAFTSGEQANWHPLTWISHILDYQFYGRNAGPAHITAVVLHILASLMLFVFLRRATGSHWRSGLVAFIFALHPLHVESVAWISERKDILCAFFWFLTSWAWVRYTERPGIRRYLLVVAPFCLGLLSKPMIVTLPLILLLLDFWPLRRTISVKLLLEKVPLVTLAAAGSAITYLVQHAAGATKSLDMYPVGLRVENALTSWMIYIGKMFWPTKLPFFYPYPDSIPVWKAALAGIAIVAISLTAIFLFRKLPYLLTGWFWYFVTLIPVIGLVQVGNQARADRYMYIPMVGLSIALAWGAADAATRWPKLKPWLVSVFALACLALIPVTRKEIGYWENNESLLAHAILVTDDQFIAYHKLGTNLRVAKGRGQQTLVNLDARLKATPNSAQGHADRGATLWQLNRKEEAVSEYRAAIGLDPRNEDALIGYGVALEDQGRMPDALAEYDKALRLNPDSPQALYNRGVVLSIMGRLDEAIESYQHALRVDPANPEAQNNLGATLAKQSKWTEAVAAFREAIRYTPEYAEAQRNLGEALMKTGRLNEAVKTLRVAVQLNPGDAATHGMLGYAMVNAEFLTGRYNEQIPDAMKGAIAEIREAVRLDPRLASAQENLGRLLAQDDATLPEAITHLEAANRLQPSADLDQLLRTLRAKQRAGQ